MVGRRRWRYRRGINPFEPKRRPPAQAGEKACAICGSGFGVPFNPEERYAHEVCAACIEEAVDADGRPLSFANTHGMGGGFTAIYRDTGEKREVHVCFIRGVRCVANEAYMGGIVVIPSADRER